MAGEAISNHWMVTRTAAEAKDGVKLTPKD